MSSKPTFITIDDIHYGLDQLVDFRVASKVIGVAQRTMRDMGVKRVLPIYKIGIRTTRYKVSDLLEYRESKKEV